MASFGQIKEVNRHLEEKLFVNKFNFAYYFCPENEGLSVIGKYEPQYQFITLAQSTHKDDFYYKNY